MRCPHRFIRYEPCPEGREFIISLDETHLILYAYTTDQTARFVLTISGQESPTFSSGYIAGTPRESQHLRSIPALIGLPMRYLSSELVTLRVYSLNGGSIFIVYSILENPARCDQVRSSLVTYHHDLFYIRWVNAALITRTRPNPAPILTSSFFRDRSEFTLVAGEPPSHQICILSHDFLRHVAPDAVNFNYIVVHQKVIQYIIQYNVRYPRLPGSDETLIITPTDTGPLEKLFDYSDFKSRAFGGWPT